MIKAKDNKRINSYKKETKWILSYVIKYWKAIFVYALIGICSTLLSLVGSLMSKNLIDIVTGHETGKIITVALFMIGFGCASIIFGGVSKRVSAYYSVFVQNEIQADVYNKVMESDWEALNEFRSGDLLNRINGDVSVISGSVIGWIPNLMIRGIQFVGSLVIIIYYDFTMAIIALICVPISAFLSRFLLKKMREYNDSLREASSEMMSFQEDSFQNIQSIKAFNVVEYFENEMINIQKKYKDVALKFNLLSVTTTSFMSFVAMFVSYACLGWGVYRLWSGAIVFGTLTLFLQLASNLNGSFSSLMALVPQAISTLTSVGRIVVITSLPEEYTDSLDMEKYIDDIENLEINFDKVSFNYLNGENIIEDVSINFSSGDIVGIVGHTGGGKTTLLRLLLGLIKPEAGKIIISNGNEITPVSACTRKLFGYVPQENTLFAGTIKDNLVLGTNNKSDDEIINALKISCAWSFIEKLPKGIYTEVKEGGKGFSHGQLQRIAIARAVLKDAQVLMLDEATSALDIETEQEVLQNIFNIIDNKICIAVTHRPSVLNICNRVIKVENKNIVELINGEQYLES